MAKPIKSGPRWGMVIDLDRCTGCQACATACQQENNIPPPLADSAAEGRSIRWMDVTPQLEGEYPEVKLRLIPRPCMQCDNPPCVKVCPVGATSLSDDGIVAQIYARCIGCRYCTTACPYTLRYFNWYEPSWPAEMGQALNPDVSVRPKGVVEKCTFCIQRSRDGRYPACVEVCPVGARKFGNILDPDSEIRYIIEHKRVLVLKEELNTVPRFFYFYAT